mmetsp:Transcript_39758/g.119522  ORF Transcript_39758/g.119522 Transcript_39758/m.119522 type:complete len:434 (+) Transcript_39758:2203-3504(+)
MFARARTVAAVASTFGPPVGRFFFPCWGPIASPLEGEGRGASTAGGPLELLPEHPVRLDPRPPVADLVPHSRLHILIQESAGAGGSIGRPLLSPAPHDLPDDLGPPGRVAGEVKWMALPNERAETVVAPLTELRVGGPPAAEDVAIAGRLDVGISGVGGGHFRGRRRDCGGVAPLPGGFPSPFPAYFFGGALQCLAGELRRPRVPNVVPQIRPAVLGQESSRRMLRPHPGHDPLAHLGPFPGGHVLVHASTLVHHPAERNVPRVGGGPDSRPTAKDVVAMGGANAGRVEQIAAGSPVGSGGWNVGIGRTAYAYAYAYASASASADVSGGGVGAYRVRVGVGLRDGTFRFRRPRRIGPFLLWRLGIRRFRSFVVRRERTSLRATLSLRRLSLALWRGFFLAGDDDAVFCRHTCSSPCVAVAPLADHEELIVVDY